MYVTSELYIFDSRCSIVFI